VKVDSGVMAATLDEIGSRAKELEDIGYDGLLTAETSHDPFFPALIAAEHTSRIEIGTGIAVAFARNPMNLASIGYDLQMFSEGRFILGLGSQIKAHIEKRFSMPWSHPAARMREFILAMRAIWRCWNEGEKLDFRGDFYTHTLMTPFFNPGPSPYGLPNIVLGGVGPRMTEVAGEVADGFMIHPFSTVKFMRETTLPALERGLTRAGRGRADIEIAFPVMIVVADTDEQRAKNMTAMRSRLAFYGSTPAYKPVLDAHGWGDLQPELNTRSKRGDWGGMAGLITDEMVDEICVVGTTDELPDLIHARYGDIVDRISFDIADATPDLIARLKAPRGV
jgi:probable F420-dependent oxidoreductase